MLQVDETPDDTRPRNVWPRVIAFGLVMVVAFGAVVACVAAFAHSVPPRQLTIPVAQLGPGRPTLLAVTTWGADPGGHTFGAWVVLLPSGDVEAYLSRDPTSGCQDQWQVVSEGGVARGLFVDACHPEVRYDLTGVPLPGVHVTRGLDRFDVQLAGKKVVIPVEQAQLGACASDAPAGAKCSTPGNTETMSLPAGPLAGLAGYRQEQ